MNKEKQKLFPIALKLILIISGIIVISAGLTVALSSWRFSEDSAARAEQTNFIMNELHQITIQNELEVIYSNVFLLFETIRTIHADESLESLVFDTFWRRNTSLAAIILPGEKTYTNTAFFQSYEIPVAVVDNALSLAEAYFDRALARESVIYNISQIFQIPSAGIIFPYDEGGVIKPLLVLFATDKIQNTIQSGGVYKSFVVNVFGDIILHEDTAFLSLNKDVRTHPIVSEFLENPSDNIQKKYSDEMGDSYFGSYRRIEIGEKGNVGVITVMSSEKVEEVIQEQVVQSSFLTAMVLCVSVLCVYFFSKTVSRPIKALERAARKIEGGDYEPHIKPSSHDEIGSLTRSFVQMSQGLAERERIKSTFGKFVNKEIAEQAAKGNLALGGIRKDGTIFFSDIRSFTAISEVLTPEQVVEFLNEYMSEMVKCVNETHGSVDKFIGDAIMALWGIPVSQGNPRTDALNCVRAALLMRERLMIFNATRGTVDKPIIKIGCGINTGAVIAGQIGSEDRMEYTVIGDAVNLASRIEALNKPFGTDILISENTYQLIHDLVIVEAMVPIKVKGKSKPLQIYAVINTIDVPGPATLAEVRELLNIQKPHATVDTEDVELKYEIMPSHSLNATVQK